MPLKVLQNNEIKNIETIRTQNGGYVTEIYAKSGDTYEKVFTGTREISGTPPLTFKSNGTVLRDYHIYGNSKVQQIDIFSADNATENYYLNSNGNSVFFSGFYITDYIAVFPNIEYKLQNTYGMTSPAICFYDANKDYISGTAYNNRAIVTLTAPQSAKYCRVSYKNLLTMTYNSEVVSVGDKTENLWNVHFKNDMHPDINTGLPVFYTGRICNETPVNVENLSSVTFDCQSNIGNNIRLIYSLFNGDEFVRRSGNLSIPYTINVTNGDKLYISLYNGHDSSVALNTNDIYDTQLIEGATTRPYEPYGYKIPVTVSGKNLLNYSSLEIGRFDFTTGEKVSDSSQLRTSTPIEVSPNGSYVIIGILSGQIRGFLYDSSMNMISTALYSNKSVISTTSSTSFINVAGIKSSWSEQIQLEAGSTATTYEPYHEPITTTLYLDEPLATGESISMSDTGIAIPTISGTNILTVDTQVQPSRVDVKGKIKQVETATVSRLANTAVLDMDLSALDIVPAAFDTDLLEDEKTIIETEGE